MNAKNFFLCILLVMGSNVWAVEEAPHDTPKQDQPVIPDVELPADFLQATPIPLPVLNTTPVEPSKPAAEILPYEMEVGTSRSVLNNGFSDWSSTYVDLEMKLGDRNNIYGSLRKENRYSKTDTEIMGGFYDPIDERFTVVIEMTGSQTHYVLPSRSFRGQLECQIAKGFDANFGLSRTEYNNATVNLLTLNGEYYWGNYRAAYTRYMSFLLGNGAANSNQMQVAKYYGDRNWYGVTFSDGNELETLPSTQVLRSHVRTLVVSGRHWILPRLALTYTFGNYRQGSFYTRNGIQLGLRRQF
jgi:YaiO family outer membrane protein